MKHEHKQQSSGNPATSPRPLRVIYVVFCTGSAALLKQQVWFCVSGPVEIHSGCVCQQPVRLCLYNDSMILERV